MKTSTLQAMLATNSGVIRMYEDVVASLRESAKIEAKAGEKAFAIEDYKRAAANSKTLAKAVKLQKDIKAELASNHRDARLESKKTKLFGPKVHKVPLLTSGEVEDILDGIIKVKFPPKADTRPANHPSFAKN